ncbi:exosome complex component RRP46 [Vespa velutina]|uniref:exosome complex component RRP46 n=1 Tax=Vespa crabro TaxID=7445 RepID=UPI001EFFBC23|nr:exosome complex component RRP46 [Vespa crabro]XP_047363910.1 exosome complex component RRP46 [Vespa velutina]
MEEDITTTEYMLRPMLCELNHLSMPDGSAMLMQGDTAVIAGVYGPVEPKAQKMIYDKASVEVVYSPVKGPAKIDDRMIELYVKESCETGIIVMLHPGTAICINIQEIQDNGGLLACTINSACLALINSGISMKFTIAAITCMIEKDSDNIILDPNNDQLQNAKAVFTFTYDSIKKDIISCSTTGRFTDKEFLECSDKCRQASSCVFNFYRDVVKRYAKSI